MVAPPFLYRGESLSELLQDQGRVGTIKQFHLTGQGLWSKLVNKGNPYALVQLGLLEGVLRHVADPDNFTKTHFLSFTSNEAVARKFASQPPVAEPEDIAEASYPDKTWRHTKYAVFKLSIAGCTPVAEGIYRLRYNSGTNVALLVNAVEYLSALPPTVTRDDFFQTALDFATNDSEWLVLPADPIGDATLSACLRNGSDLDVVHFVESTFFTDREGGSGFI